MKRAKMMLIAIAVLATVGGALAFKANSKFNFDYCFRTLDVTNDITTKCTDEIIGYKTKQSETQNLTTYYYTVKEVENCANAACTSTTTLAKE